MTGYQRCQMAADFTGAEMPRIIRLTLLVLAILPPAARAQDRVRTEYLESASLGGRVRFHVVLPVHYDSTGSYPLLWLLHGIAGDDSSWLRYPQLLRSTLRYPMIVVLPAARRSFYVNSAVAANAKYETFITQELHEAVVRRFAVDTLREAIAGASMGGYGAAVLALRYPTRYRFAGLIIPAMSLPDSLQKADSTVASWVRPALDSAFGPAPSRHRETHDPFRLLHQIAPEALPYFYITVAEGDEFPSFVPMSRAFTYALRTLQVPYEYHEMPGGHNDAVADAALPALVDRWMEFATAAHHSPPH